MRSNGVGRGMPAALLILSLALMAPSGGVSAAGLEGLTVKAEGIVDRLSYNAANKDFTYPLEIYFGNKGNRFVMMGATTGNARVMIPTGSDKGIQRRKDGHFINAVKLRQSGGSISVLIQGRGVDSTYASETWSFKISITGPSCHIDNFHYVPDPGQYLTKSKSRAGACTVTAGQPSGLNDE